MPLIRASARLPDGPLCQAPSRAHPPRKGPRARVAVAGRRSVQRAHAAHRRPPSRRSDAPSRWYAGTFAGTLTLYGRPRRPLSPRRVPRVARSHTMPPCPPTARRSGATCSWRRPAPRPRWGLVFAAVSTNVERILRLGGLRERALTTVLLLLTVVPRLGRRPPARPEPDPSASSSSVRGSSRGSRGRPPPSVERSAEHGFPALTPGPRAVDRARGRARSCSGA